MGLFAVVGDRRATACGINMRTGDGVREKIAERSVTNCGSAGGVQVRGRGPVKTCVFLLVCMRMGVRVKAAKSSLKAHLREPSFKTDQLSRQTKVCAAHTCAAEPTCTHGHKVDP